MNERSIQILLMQEYLAGRNHVVAIPNSTQLLRGEVDLLTVTKAGFVNEFEIKCTRADFTRDFRTKRYKHQELEIKGNYGGVGYTTYLPNYFWFVTLEFEIEPPSYAGWIHVKKYAADETPPYKYVDGEWVPDLNTTHHLSEVKRAPRLHKGKWNADRIAKTARLLSFRLLKEYKNEQ